jgi:type VI secretion system protein VasJ
MGDSIAYDPDFDAVKNEIGKLGALDYELIESKSLSMIRSKCKDLRVMAFVSFSLLKSDKWEAFADLFDGMTQLAEKSWDALFPERPRAKELALKWLSEDRFKDLVAQKTPTEKEYEHVARLAGSLTKLKAILEPKFPQGSPFPAELCKKAQQWETATKPKPKPAAPVPGSAPSGTPGGGEEPMETPKQAQAIARKAARFLEEKDAPRIMGFRLMRSIRWDLFEKAPPAENGKTQLTGPNEQQRTYLANLLSQKEWKTLFDKSEETFASAANHLWLPLPRFSAMAAKELGEPYKEVRRAILMETRYFLERIPDIVNLSFTDGTPFCDDATRQWIAEEVAAAGGSGAPAGKSKAPADPLEAEEKEVNALVAANQLEKALEVLQNGMRNSSREEDNFKRSILVGKLLLKAKQPDIALSVLESLDDKIALFHLDRWDPDLAIEAWSVLVQAIKVAKAGKPQNILASMSEKQAAILKKISQISPQKAFELNK